MFRLPRVVPVCCLALALFPAAASAQFYPSVAPPNPLYQHPAYRFQFSVGVTVPTVFGRAFVGMTSPSTATPQLFSPNLYTGPEYPGSYGNMYGWNSRNMVTSGYISGGGLRNDAVRNAQREFEKAQRDATASRIQGNTAAAKDLIYDQWAYEKLGVMGTPGLKPGKEQPEELVKALNVTDPAEVTSGEALNHILVAVVAAEGKGAKGPSAFLAPQVLDQVRFSGPPVAEALNYLRQAGHLAFPVAFSDPKLKSVRESLEKDFAAAVTPLRSGKPVESARLAKLEGTLKVAQDAATPVIRNLPFEDAVAARRFLNRFETVMKVMKTPSAQTLLVPGWATEGTSVADLVRHMARHKLLFGAAPPRGEANYLALHKGLATYLFVISQPKK